MKTRDFRYDLPKHLIAQRPLDRRDESRLLVVDKTHGTRRHTRFKKLHEHLRKGDVLVLNDTAVRRARLTGRNERTGGAIEVLLLREKEEDVFEALAKKAKKVRQGTRIVFGGGLLRMECVGVGEEGLRDFRLEYEGDLDRLLERLGEMPLPPYIHEELEDADRYQTVYSQEKKSAAAPTAGLHFTKDYLDFLRERGIVFVTITLHVGLATFRPVSVARVDDHKMHEEYYEVSEAAAATLNRAKAAGKRIVAVGTTSVRTLETIATSQGRIEPGSGKSDLFIRPGYKFKVVDCLLTNFHLPESTLLMLVSAFATRDTILEAYKEAMEKEYRFYSFGDAMFLTDEKI